MSGSIRVALSCCFALCFAHLARAQPAPETSGSATTSPASTEQDRDEARALFSEGLEFVEHEDWVNAEERFRRVLALHSSHVAAYNLGSALARLGRLVEAAEVLRSILRAEDVDAPTSQAAQQLLLETEPRIGSLTIRITGDLTGVRFALDSKPLELTAQVQTISIDPGEHVIDAQRGAETLAQGRVTVGGSAPLQAELSLELPARLAPERVASAAELAPSDAARAHTAPAPDQRDGEASSGAPWWLWAAGGVAVAAAAAVTVALVVAGAEATPVMGDTNPPVVRGRVR